MNSPARDIKDYLLVQSAESGSDLELVFKTNLFIGILPESTQLIVSLFDTSGESPEPNEIMNPTLQIMVRGIQGGYEAAYAKMESIVSLLHALSNTTINSTKYIQIWKMSEIMHVGNDDKTRPIFSCNLRIKRS